MAVLSQLMPPIRPRVRMGSAPADDGYRRSVHTAGALGQQERDDRGDLARGVTQRAGSALGMAARFWSVSIVLGRTQFTRTALAFSSSARLSVSRWTALLAAA